MLHCETDVVARISLVTADLEGNIPASLVSAVILPALWNVGMLRNIQCERHSLSLDTLFLRDCTELAYPIASPSFASWPRPTYNVLSSVL